MRDRRTKWRARALLVWVLATYSATAQTGSGWVSGSVLDPSELPVVNASVAVDSVQGAHLTAATGSDGSFAIHLPASGMYTVRVEALGFAHVMRTMQLRVGTAD
jgi:hypothetical protein